MKIDIQPLHDLPQCTPSTSSITKLAWLTCLSNLSQPYPGLSDLISSWTPARKNVLALLKYPLSYHTPFSLLHFILSGSDIHFLAPWYLLALFTHMPTSLTLHSERWITLTRSQYNDTNSFISTSTIFEDQVRPHLSSYTRLYIFFTLSIIALRASTLGIS